MPACLSALASLTRLPSDLLSEPKVEAVRLRVSTVVTALAVGVLFAISMSTFWDLRPGQTSGRTITVYGYSAMEEPLKNEVIPAFQEWYERTHGEEVKVVTAFAGSGHLFNQIRAGAPAQVAIFAAEIEPTKLMRDGLITTDWRTYPGNGTFAFTVAVILTRDGNPENILSFEDLANEGIDILLPDPTTSGGAQWAILALYGSALLDDTGSPSNGGGEFADELLKRVVDNASSLPESARKALTQFGLGYGDVLLTYENEALVDISKGRDYEIIVPQSTIAIEPKVVTIDANVREQDEELVQAFVDFLWSTEAQEAMARHHFRVVDDTVSRRYSADIQEVESPFTIADLGGWDAASEQIIEGAWREAQRN